MINDDKNPFSNMVSLIHDLEDKLKPCISEMVSEMVSVLFTKRISCVSPKRKLKRNHK